MAKLYDAAPMQTATRVPLAEFEPALKKRLEELWGAPPNLYRALANHPALIAAWTEFSRMLRYDTRTPRALRELVILRGGQVMGSEYEWAQHLPMARKAGVREAQIRDLASWKSSPQFDDHDYVELAAVASFYAMVGRMLDAMGVPLDADVADYQPKLK